MHRKTKPTARKQPPGQAASVAAYDGIPGTPLSCTPIIMGRKAGGRRRASTAAVSRPPRRPSAS
jgi:hypothetical protein